MFTVAIVCLAPSVMFLTARLFSKKHAASRPPALFEWLADALLLLSLTLLLFLPLRRVTVSPWVGHPLSFRYGKTAAIASVLMGALLGALQALCRGDWALESSARRPRRLELLWRLPLRLFGLTVLVLTAAYLWGIRNYPVVTFDEIFFHLHAPLQGTAKSFIADVLLCVALPSAVLSALYELFVWFPGRKDCLTMRGLGCIRMRLTAPRHISLPLSLLSLCAMSVLLFSCLDPYLDLTDNFIPSLLHSSTLIQEEYADPALTALVFPQQKRNLISIYLESGETTFQDPANGGISHINYTPEMTRIAAENVTFSQSDLIQGAAITPGAGWTIAGLVAQTSGLPLKFYSTEVGGWMNDFLTGATTLGDILHAQGYRNVFMAGSDFTFGGRRQYFSQHGDYEIWDLFSARDAGVLPQDYYEAWGFEDRKLYAYAKEALSELSASDQPFHLCMLTVDTHIPGFTFDCCPEDIDEPYLRTVACASRQLGEFIDWCERQPFFENTTIVITGDHASIADPALLNIAAEGNDQHLGSVDRLVYNAFIHAAAEPVQAHNRLFTTLDFFPTTLASLGVTIEGDRLGLGTNLFSGRETLAEQYGYETLFWELLGRSAFYDEQLMYPKK